MNCLKYISQLRGVDKPDELPENFSGNTWHAKTMVLDIEKHASKTFETWKALKEYYMQYIANTDFVAKDINTVIDCKSIIEKFCFIEIVENTWNFAPKEFETIIIQNFPKTNFFELYNYMVIFSRPEISIAVYKKYQKRFSDVGFTMEKYLETLAEWLFSYTVVNKLEFEFSGDQIYLETGKAMSEWLAPEEIEFWVRYTIRSRYGDSIFESYWFWLRTLVIFNICKHSSFRLSFKAFEMILNSGLLEFDIEVEKDLDMLDEFYCIDELTGIILYHEYQSPMADLILYFKKVRDRLVSDKNYDDLKVLFEKYNCDFEKPERGWSVKIPKSNPGI